ncbi:MAG: hypothetical protein ACQEQI_00215 [Bacillota bacterium]
MTRKILLILGVILVVIGLTLVASEELSLDFKESTASNKQQSSKQQDKKLSQAEVTSQAKELGMRFPDNLTSDEIKEEIKRVGLELANQPQSLPAKENQSDQVEIITLQISQGATAEDVVDSLHQAGIIEDKKALLEFINRAGMENNLLAGKYEFQTNTPVEKILIRITGSRSR